MLTDGKLFESGQRKIPDGLKDAVVRMLAGESVPVDIGGFSNDMTTFHCVDDVLALLVHLGYLTYNKKTASVLIPNKEVSIEYITSIKRIDSWGEVVRSVEESRRLLQSLWNMDTDAVAAGIDRAHELIETHQDCAGKVQEPIGTHQAQRMNTMKKAHRAAIQLAEKSAGWKAARWVSLLLLAHVIKKR